MQLSELPRSHPTVQGSSVTWNDLEAMIRNGNLKQAHELDRLIDEDNENAFQYLYFKGRIMRKFEQNWGEAAKFYLESIDLNPASPRSHYELGPSLNFFLLFLEWRKHRFLVIFFPLFV